MESTVISKELAQKEAAEGEDLTQALVQGPATILTGEDIDQEAKATGRSLVKVRKHSKRSRKRSSSSSSSESRRRDSRNESRRSSPERKETNGDAVKEQTQA